MVLLGISTHPLVSRVPHLEWNALYTMKYSKTLGDFGNCMSILFIISHVMLSNDDKEWVSSTYKNGDNHELENECVSKYHHR